MDASSPPKTRDELRSLLLDQLIVVRSLLESVEDPSVQTAQLARLVVRLERLYDRRDELIRALREEATEVRKREEERSARQFVLRALDELGVPQNAGFLQEYVWAREGVDLNTRGFGALRRDERRSWNRRPGRRLAYIVPTLSPDGRALARWLARSDWPLERRITVQGSGERMLDLYKICALVNLRQRDEQQKFGDPFIFPIGKYSREMLGVEPPPEYHGASREQWVAEVTRKVQAELSTLAGTVSEVQRTAATRFVELPEEQQLWGVPGSNRRPHTCTGDGGA